MLPPPSRELATAAVGVLASLGCNVPQILSIENTAHLLWHTILISDTQALVPSFHCIAKGRGRFDAADCTGRSIPFPPRMSNV